MKSDKIAVNPDNDVKIKLFLLYVLYQLILHAYFFLVAKDPRLLLPHVIAFIHDIALLGIVTAIGYFSTAVSPDGQYLSKSEMNSRTI